MSLNLKISVVTVCFSAENTIEDTINSILDQTYKNIEYIIIDGASKDGTMDIVKKYADRLAYWISEPDKGVYDAMNKGIDMATGDYICFMNAGDSFFSKTTISNVVQKIPHNMPDVIFGDSISINKKGDRCYLKSSGEINGLNAGPIYRHGASLVKTSVHKKNKFAIDLKHRYGYALDFLNIHTMFRMNCSFHRIDECVLCFEEEGISNHPYLNIKYNFRITHDGNKPSIKEYLKLYKQYITCFLLRYRLTKGGYLKLRQLIKGI